MTNFDELKHDSLASLSREVSAAKSAKPINIWEFENPMNFDLIPTDGRFVYVFEDRHCNPEETYRLMTEFKAKSSYQCPRLNAPSQYPYVGCMASEKGLPRRMKEHLGVTNAKSKSAMHWQKWAHGLPFPMLTILQYEVSQRVLGLIEDAIFEALMPAFGKPGPNNKS